MAEAEAKVHEAKLIEGQKKRMLKDRINREREKWIATINTTFSHIEADVLYDLDTGLEVRSPLCLYLFLEVAGLVLAILLRNGNCCCKSDNIFFICQGRQSQ